MTKKKLKLDNFFKLYSCEDLVRIGRDYDGGYIISKRDILSSEHLMGFGINIDWSFEKHFSELKNVCVHAYDGSTRFKLFLKQSLESLSRFDLLNFIIKPFKYLSFLYFFGGKNTFFKKYVGFDYGDNFISIGKILKNLKSNKVFIKMDIEGSEYRCLDDLLKFQNKLTGLAIEFHDVDIHIDKIQKFINKFKLRLIHVHANNFAPVSSKGIPFVLELTFSKSALLDKSKSIRRSLPIEIDMPNNKKAEDISIIC